MSSTTTTTTSSNRSDSTKSQNAEIENTTSLYICANGSLKGFDKMPRGWHLSDNQYYISYPHNFGNEYTVYVVDRPETVAWCEQQCELARGNADSTFARITRTHAIYRGIKALRAHARDRAAGNAVDLLAGGLYGDPVLSGRTYGDILSDSAASLAADTIVCDCGHVTVSELLDSCEVCGPGGEDNE